MAAAQRPAPFTVLKYMVNMVDTNEFDPTGDPEGKGWRQIEYASKRSYGCGDTGEAVVQGLRLYMRLRNDSAITTELAIRISDEAVRSIQAELDRRGSPIVTGHTARPVDPGARVLVVDQRLMVLDLVFRLHHTRIGYYLVYDDIDASLSLISLHENHKTVHAMSSVLILNRTGAAQGGDYELVILAHDRATRSYLDSHHVLLMCTPETRASSDDGNPWQTKARRFPDQPRQEHVDIFTGVAEDVVVAFKGKAFWTDFSQGRLVYADLDDARSSNDVGFEFISLPREFQPDREFHSYKMTRTMGRVGDSICLVLIDDRPRAWGKHRVTMWTLDLDERKWAKELEVSAKELWEMDGFKEARVLKRAPEYPILAADGSICVVLDDQTEIPDDGDPSVDRICCFDVRRRRLLWHARVHDYSSYHTVVLPHDFFGGQHRRPRKRARSMGR